MNWLSKSIAITFLLLATSSPAFEVPPESWPAIRPGMRDCAAYAALTLKPGKRARTSVGYKLTKTELSPQAPEQLFREMNGNIDYLIKNHGREVFNKSEIVITGYHKESKSFLRQKANEFLIEKGLNPKAQRIRIRVMVIPKLPELSITQFSGELFAHWMGNLYRASQHAPKLNFLWERLFKGYENGEVLLQDGLRAHLGQAIKGIPEYLQTAPSRVRYIFASKTRDFEKPVFGEFALAAATSGFAEIPTAIRIWAKEAVQRGHPIDASLTLGFHYTTLMSFDVFSKTLVNWINRKGISKTKKGEWIATLSKQLFLSSIFVVYFNVFPNATEIAQFAQSHGITETLFRTPAEIGNFLSRQGLTPILQTFFYTQVMSNGLYKWVGDQNGSENSLAARTYMHIAKIPYIAPNAYIINYTSGKDNSSLFSHWFLPDINDGHIYLALFTGAAIFANRYRGEHNIFNKTLPHYVKAKEAWIDQPIQSLNEKFFDPARKRASSWAMTQMIKRALRNSSIKD